MSDQATQAKGEPTQGQAENPTQGKGGKTFTQEELDQKIQARIAEEKAKFKDYEAYKEKAGKFDAEMEKSKSETDKLNDRLSALEAENRAMRQASEQAAWRAEIRKEKGLPEGIDSLLTGATREEIEKKADVLVANMPKKTEKPVVRGDTGDNTKQGGGAADSAYAALASNLFGGE